MRQYRVFIIILLTLMQITVPQLAFANSGPVYIEGYPSYEVMAVDKECPIRVGSEKLTFDLTDNDSYKMTVWGKVQASYVMENPTERDISVKMAFPFVSRIDDLISNDIEITADGVKLDYEIFIGDVVNSYGDPSEEESSADLSFEKIVGSITEEPYKAENFTATEKGKLYLINVKPTADERINFAVSFSFDKNRSKVLINGFNRYERQSSHVRIASWCYEPQTLEIFVLGEDIDFDIEVYSDGELSEKTENYSYEIKTEEVELKSYLLQIAEEYRQEYLRMRGIPESAILNFTENKIYNLFGRALDRALNANEGYSSWEDIVSQNYFERIFTLVYNVDFPAKSKKNVTVSYKAAATMDKRRTREPVYTLNYILNPARYWAGFGNLDIEIITPEEAPFILDSSIEFYKVQDRLYRAHLDSLPQNDLTFSVYEKEKITVLDRVFSNPYTFYFSAIILLIVLLVAAIIFAVQLIKRIWVKKSGDDR